MGEDGIEEFRAKKPDYVSDSGSKYWLLEEGVVRQSDHWGKVGNCRWEMSQDADLMYNVYGYNSGNDPMLIAYWDDFTMINK